VGLKHAHITPKVVTDPGKTTLSKTHSPQDLTVDGHEEDLACLSGGVGCDALKLPLIPGTRAGNEQRPGGLQAVQQGMHQGQPLPHGEQREGQTPHFGRTLRWARWLVLQVPVGARREVWAQGVAILLPLDVGLGGSLGIAAQRGRLLSQQDEVGRPGGDGGRDCGRAWQQ